MAQEFTEREERRIAGQIADLTADGHHSVGGPFWTDVIAAASKAVEDHEFMAQQNREMFHNEDAAQREERKAALASEVLRRLEEM